jgi:hypothetical protein
VLKYFSDRIGLYRNRRGLTYQSCPSIDQKTRRRFTSPFPSSLIIMNAPLVRSLYNSISTSNNYYLFENLYGNLLELSLINISSPLSSGVPKRNSPLTRSRHTKHPLPRLTRLHDDYNSHFVFNELFTHMNLYSTRRSIMIIIVVVVLYRH